MGKKLWLMVWVLWIFIFLRINYRKISLITSLQGVTDSRHVTLKRITALLSESRMIWRKTVYYLGKQEKKSLALFLQRNLLPPSPARHCNEFYLFQVSANIFLFSGQGGKGKVFQVWVLVCCIRWSLGVGTVSSQPFPYLGELCDLEGSGALSRWMMQRYSWWFLSCLVFEHWD